MPGSLALTVVQISIWNMRMHSFWVWTLVGLASGWLAGMAFRGRGFGTAMDIILGVGGSIAGGWLFMNYGLMGGDFLYSLVAAAAGAFALVGVAHLIADDEGG